MLDKPSGETLVSLSAASRIEGYRTGCPRMEPRSPLDMVRTSPLTIRATLMRNLFVNPSRYGKGTSGLPRLNKLGLSGLFHLMSTTLWANFPCKLSTGKGLHYFQF